LKSAVNKVPEPEYEGGWKKETWADKAEETSTNPENKLTFWITLLSMWITPEPAKNSTEKGSFP
jgi:hypothetical protein